MNRIMKRIGAFANAPLTSVGGLIVGWGRSEGGGGRGRESSVEGGGGVSGGGGDGGGGRAQGVGGRGRGQGGAGARESVSGQPETQEIWCHSLKRLSPEIYIFFF
jgi:hypothetical protein